MARASARSKPILPTPRVVWITRAEPGASATARGVVALRLKPVVEPLLEVRPIPGADLDLGGVCAIAFTSANAVRAFADQSPERALRVFAVGDATAAAARAARFATVLSASGDVAALASALASRRRELDGVILNPSAAEPAADLPAALAEIGLTVRYVPVYETVERTPPDAFLDGLAEIDHVLVHSAKAARALAAVVKVRPAPHLVALVLSKQVAQPLARAGLAAVTSAAEPNETALLSLLLRPRSG